MEEDGSGGLGGVRGSDGDDVADAEVALVEVGRDEILAERAGLEGGGGGGELGLPGGVVGGAVCGRK